MSLLLLVLVDRERRGPLPAAEEAPRLDDSDHRLQRRALALQAEQQTVEAREVLLGNLALQPAEAGRVELLDDLDVAAPLESIAADVGV